ncbi:MAG: FAD-dependent protein [Ferruginibacter sp.]
MQQHISLKLSPSDASDNIAIKKKIAQSTGRKITEISGYQILKRSIDARGKNILINLTVNAFVGEPFHESQPKHFTFKDVSNSQRSVLIIGAGPAGLFAALKLLEAGIKPVILERGKDVKARRRDLAKLNREGIVNPESNYCFGEGGAGTYSDGKLYTRSNKRGDIKRILNLFVQFGAPENILYDAHPHIGTNKLPQLITAMRQVICDHGGKLLFEKKVTAFKIDKGLISYVETSDKDNFTADTYILATGHSARDVFKLLDENNIFIEPKPFALGVRIEHPQSLIDNIQYHCISRDEILPPASYSVVEQVNDKGVFSFCMCPGGIIAPAATDTGQLVVNGWSPSKRNNAFANSGMVVQVSLADAVRETKHLHLKENDPLIFMEFQKLIEQKAYDAGGGNFVAPALRMVDFTTRTISSSLPVNSYLPGLNSSMLDQVLPSFIYDTLSKGFISFGKNMKGFFTNEAVVVATESRTSSPVRIPRDTEKLSHPQLQNLYPCGEGAGYAGGIVSAAMDGENVASKIIEKLLHK